MFTGLVEAVASVADVEELEGARRVTVRAPGLSGELAPGESIAVDGACLTAVAAGPESFVLEVVGTTLSRTIARNYRPGTRVNLERALRLADRLGGHFVQGHVDGLGELLEVRREGAFHLMEFRLPGEVEEVTIPRGSIAINGVSLTVNALEPGRCQVAVIPHTWERTNLSDLRPRDPVNLEGDMIGRYVARYLATRTGEVARPTT